MEEREKLAKEIMVSVCETDEILEDYDMNLFEAGFIDSFALIQIIVLVEEKTGIKLQPTDISKEEVCSVNKMIEFLNGICER